MSEKEISKNRVIAQAEKLRDKKDADLKLAQASWCGNEPHELEGPVLPKNPDDPCGSTPVVLQGPKDPMETDDPCGNGRKPHLPGGQPKPPLDPRLGKFIKKQEG